MMLSKPITKIELASSNYVAVEKDGYYSYGGNQSWFNNKDKNSRDSILRESGCGTIATTDLLLYLSQHSNTGITNRITYDEYDTYVRMIDQNYTKTDKHLAVLGPKVASAINQYSKKYRMKIKAKWMWFLSDKKMLSLIEDMLQNDIPVILAIGPNIPKLWGAKGISFYHVSSSNNTSIEYRETIKDVNSHYVVVTGIIKDAHSIVFRISSWGKEYYINYPEYLRYRKKYSSRITCSLVLVRKLPN